MATKVIESADFDSEVTFDLRGHMASEGTSTFDFTISKYSLTPNLKSKIISISEFTTVLKGHSDLRGHQEVTGLDP